MNKYQQLIEVLNNVGTDAERAYAGNKAATARVRLAMQVVKSLAQEVRLEMLELRG